MKLAFNTQHPVVRPFVIKMFALIASMAISAPMARAANTNFYEIVYEDGVAVFMVGQATPNVIIDNYVDVAGVYYPVRIVHNNAFRARHDITGVYLPGGITNIQPLAFAYSSTVKDVIFGDNTYGDDLVVGSSAFAVCPALASIELPARIDRIEDMAFHDCKNLMKVYFSGAFPVHSIGGLAFYGTGGASKTLTIYCRLAELAKFQNLTNSTSLLRGNDGGNIVIQVY